MAEQGETGIAWTDQTWNPVRGCSRVSDGCTNCYAETVAARYSFPATDKRKAGAYLGLAKFNGAGEPRWTGEVRMVPEHLADPLRWTKPRRVFVNSMSDLFHEKLTNEQIAAVFGIMAGAPRHTFQALTKRADRMRDWFQWVQDVGPARPLLYEHARRAIGSVMNEDKLAKVDHTWPLPNVWLGVSAENQATADERIPLLLECPAAVRWVSAEPLLGPINFRPWLNTECTHEDGYTEPDTNAVICRKCDEQEILDWIVIGGESGPSDARACEVAWVRSIVHQCQSARVAPFAKQLGSHVIDRNDAGFHGQTEEAWPVGTTHNVSTIRQGGPVRVLLKHRKGGDLSEWPADLRVREYPQ